MQEEEESWQLNTCSLGSRLNLASGCAAKRLLKLSCHTKAAAVKLNCCLHVIMRGEKPQPVKPRFLGYECLHFGGLLSQLRFTVGLLISHLLAPTGIFLKLVPNDKHTQTQVHTEAEGNPSILPVWYDALGFSFEDMSVIGNRGQRDAGQRKVGSSGAGATSSTPVQCD